MQEIIIGSTAPDFTLPDQQGQPWRLEDALAQGKIVAVFYRGDW